MASRRYGKTPIMSEERRVEYFSQCNIHGIVSTEIVPQSPNPREEEVVGVPPDGKGEEVVEGSLSPVRIDLFCQCKSTDDLSDFDIEQIRRMKGLERTKQPGFDGCA